MNASKHPKNTRLAWALAGVVLVVFLLTFWKFRPL